MFLKEATKGSEKRVTSRQDPQIRILYLIDEINWWQRNSKAKYGQRGKGSWNRNLTIIIKIICIIAK